jgi:hypothetical protein
MVNEEGHVEINYDLINIKNNQYIVSIRVVQYASSSKKRIYKIGDIIPVPDCVINTNNCKRLRECIVDKLIPIEDKIDSYYVYVTPTLKEFDMGPRLDLRNFGGGSFDGNIENLFDEDDEDNGKKESEGYEH